MINPEGLAKWFAVVFISMFLFCWIFLSGCALLPIKTSPCDLGCWKEVPRSEFVLASETPGNVQMFISLEASDPTVTVAKIFYITEKQNALLALLIDGDKDGSVDRILFMVGRLDMSKKELPLIFTSPPMPVSFDHRAQKDFDLVVKYWNEGKGCFPATEWEKHIKVPVQGESI